MTGVQTCALPISSWYRARTRGRRAHQQIEAAARGAETDAGHGSATIAGGLAAIATIGSPMQRLALVAALVGIARADFAAWAAITRNNAYVKVCEARKALARLLPKARPCDAADAATTLAPTVVELARLALAYLKRNPDGDSPPDGRGHRDLHAPDGHATKSESPGHGRAERGPNAAYENAMKPESLSIDACDDVPSTVCLLLEHALTTEGDVPDAWFAAAVAGELPPDAYQLLAAHAPSRLSDVDQWARSVARALRADLSEQAPRHVRLTRRVWEILDFGLVLRQLGGGPFVGDSSVPAFVHDGAECVDEPGGVAVEGSGSAPRLRISRSAKEECFNVVLEDAPPDCGEFGVQSREPGVNAVFEFTSEVSGARVARALPFGAYLLFSRGEGAEQTWPFVVEDDELGSDPLGQR